MHQVTQQVIRAKAWLLQSRLRILMVASGAILLLLLGVCIVAAAHHTNVAHHKTAGGGGSPGASGRHSTSGTSTTRSEKAAAGAPAATSPAPSAKASTTPAPAATPPSQPLPATVLNLTNWRLTLPTNTSHDGDPDEINQPELAHFISPPYFDLTPAKDGVVFEANAGGATTDNSSYPRSELREMASNGTKQASWSNDSGTHTMVVREAITHLPVVKLEVVAAQIHDSSDDVIMIKLSGSHLFVEANSKNIGDLDTNYALGTAYTAKIVASGGHIQVYFNDALKVDYAKSKSGLYFKAGCYTQSNVSKGDAPDAYAQVVIYALQVTHQ